MTRQPPDTYEIVALHTLVHEWDDEHPEKAIAKLTARLKRKKLGGFDATRVDRLRRMQRDVADEIGKWERSDYYTYPHRRGGSLEDYDVSRLTSDMVARHPQVPAEAIERFVGFAIYWYYLR